MGDPLFWHRLQFGFTATFHYLFPQLTMGLALLIAVFKGLGLRPGNERFNEAARFWIRILGINFAVGVVTGYFNIPLFTSFRVQNPVGILDWYTVLMGVFVTVTLAGHGATFLAWKTAGPVQDRCLRLAMPLWGAVGMLWVAATFATAQVSPAVFQGWAKAPLAWLGTAIYLGGLAAVVLGLRGGKHLVAFLGSSAFILGILAASAASVWPVMLRSTLDPAWHLTAHNASVATSGLQKGLVWWIIGFPIALGYFAMLFRRFQGKVQVPAEGEGY